MRIALALFCLCTSPALAMETPWQDLAPNVRARLISNDQITAQGTTLVGLELDMPPAVRTYWRVPGETGIPTEFDFSASQGVDGHVVEWPMPRIDAVAGYTDFTYFGSVVLPVELALSGRTARIDVSVLLGICSDVCVPAQARFDLALDFAKPDRGQGARLRQALAEVPLPWTQGPAPIGDVRLAPDGTALTLAVQGADLDAASLIATFADGVPLVGAPQKSPEPNLVTMPLLGTEAEKGLEGQPVQIIFDTPDGPFALTRTVLPAAF